LIVDSLGNDNLLLAARNVNRAKVVGTSGLNIYDLLYHEKLVVSRAAVEELAQILDPQSQKSNGRGRATEQEAGDAAADAQAGTEEEAA
jgi:hypothetical protein